MCLSCDTELSTAGTKSSYASSIKNEGEHENVVAVQCFRVQFIMLRKHIKISDGHKIS